jgi:hypothetical protein
MMMKGKELLASDRLSLLAGRESRTMEGEKRTSEALDWLDKRLQADLQKTKSLVGSTPESPAVAVFREETAHVLPTKSKAEILRERIERRGMPDTEKSMKSEFAESGISYLSQEAKARISSIKEGRGHPVWHQGSAMPAQQKDIELWADQNHRQRASLVHVKPFPDLSATSKAARASAAPFIAGIYDQIFVDGVEETCGEADVEPIRDRFQDCTLVLDEAWDTVDGAKDSVGGEFVGRRSHYERRLTQNLADALQVPLHRIKVNEMRPGPSWYRAQELIIELTLIPDAGGHPPSCKEMCTDLANQAKTAGSKLRSHMPAIRVEFPQDGDLPYHAAQKQDGMVFSFLRGGIVEEKQAKTPRPDTSLIARDFVTNSSQHVQYMVQQVGTPPPHQCIRTHRGHTHILCIDRCTGQFAQCCDADIKRVNICCRALP